MANRINTPALWIVADLLLDAIVRLDTDEALTHGPDHQAHALVDLVPGGGALHAAVGAVAAGFHPIHVLAGMGQFGSVGNAGVIEKLFATDGVEFHLDEQQTSIAITVLVHVGTTSRLLFSRPSPYALRLEHVKEVLNATRTGLSGFLYLSGYVLFDKQRTSVAREVLRYAQDSGLTTVLDVVPHRIYSRVTASEFIQLTQHVNVLISGAPTLARIFRHDAKDLLHLPVESDLIFFDDGHFTVRRSGSTPVTGPGPTHEGPWRGVHDRFAMGLLATHFGGLQ